MSLGSRGLVCLFPSLSFIAPAYGSINSATLRSYFFSYVQAYIGLFGFSCGAWTLLKDLCFCLIASLSFSYSFYNKSFLP